MKKLMMFVAVCVVGLYANAAMVTWGADVVGNGAGGEAPDGWLAYFIETGSYGRDKAVADVASGKTDFLSNATGSAVEVDGGEIAGVITGLGASQTITGYMVIFNSDDAASATYAYVTSAKSGSTTALGGNGQITWDIEDATSSFANWTSMSGGSTIPEPTSGLLLLVGGAMLALRRKRA